jgi:hypothetical protein
MVAISCSEGHWPRIECLRLVVISHKRVLRNKFMSESMMADSTSWSANSVVRKDGSSKPDRIWSL